MHETRSSPSVIKYTCECGKFYLHQQSLRNHKMKCTFIEEVIEPIPQIPTHTVDQLIIELKQDMHSQKIEFQKEQACFKQAFDEERQEMKAQIALLLEKHAGPSTNCNNTNIETQQNIIININSFGNENTDYIDDKAILACISRVYKSIPALLEKIHYWGATPP